MSIKKCVDSRILRSPGIGEKSFGDFAPCRYATEDIIRSREDDFLAIILILLKPECDPDLGGIVFESGRSLRDELAGLVKESDVSELEQGSLLVLTRRSLGVFTRSHTKEQSAFNELTAGSVELRDVLLLDGVEDR